jgi:RNA recognition motif-containing protein
MNSPQFVKALLIAAVLAVVTYIATSFISLSSGVVSIMAFIVALVASLTTSSNSNTEEASQDVKTLYVGNLPYRANEASVRELFSQHGTVHSVRLMKDKHTGKRRGFGFVEISAEDADSAVNALNDQEFQQRTLKVREAKERPEKSSDSEE